MDNKREWTNDELFLLIDLYKSKPSLWNPCDNEYRLKSKRNYDWADIANDLSCDVPDIKKKIESLLTSFRRERTRCEEAAKPGDDPEDIYKSKWFLFEKMKFLLNKFTPRVKLDTMDSSQEMSDVPENITSESNLSAAISKSFKTFKSRKRLKLSKVPITKDRSDDMHNILLDAVQRQQERDRSSIFAEYIANKHRRYSESTKAVVEHLISDILYQADMGNYDEARRSPVEISPL